MCVCDRGWRVRSESQVCTCCGSSGVVMVGGCGVNMVGQLNKEVNHEVFREMPFWLLLYLLIRERHCPLINVYVEH